MLEMSGTKISISNLFNQYDVTNIGGINVVIDEQIGIGLPMVKITFNYDYYALPEQLTKDKEFTLSVGDNSHKLRIMQYSVIDNNYTLECFLSNNDYLNTRIQLANNDTVINTLGKLNSIKISNPDNVTTNDKQVWLQYNIPDKDFARELLTRSYISDTDFLMYYIDGSNTLNVNSYSNLIKKTPKFILGKNDGEINFNNLNVESIPVDFYNVINNFIGVATQSAYSNQYDNDTSTQVTSKLMINAGNCYDNYYNAQINNFKQYVKLFEALYSVKLSDYIGAAPLDIIKINSNIDPNNKSTVISKLYIVTRVITYIMDSGINQTIYFAKVST